MHGPCNQSNLTSPGSESAPRPCAPDTKKGKLRDYPYNINWNYGGGGAS
jgi:hypothetical protein